MRGGWLAREEKLLWRKKRGGELTDATAGLKRSFDLQRKGELCGFVGIGRHFGRRQYINGVNL